jgi:phosphopantothenoylcysteine decarboxylase/phosphopantothenate--cysteine ligase
LAKKLKNLGARVTLILGPVEPCCLDKNIKLIRFKFFNELRDIIVRKLKSKKYDIVIHSAAVSDYMPARYYGRKIKSGMRNFKLNLIPTIRIIDLIKEVDPSLCLVGFKFEPQAAKNILIKEAKRLMRQAGLDLAVANSIEGTRYLAYILEGAKIYGPMLNKKDLVEQLVDVIKEKICKI